jgi:hypothetical protein
LDAEQFAIAKELDPNDPTPWFYDAIRLQTENRPGEALKNLQRSIELNDNRAIYRSRLLLDADRAGRGASLARIYDDLGFLEPGIHEATKSLALDPASAAAHRFLSDIYVGVRRREIARVSNLLQAQMLQDLNINPIQPSLSEANLNLVTQGGPARAGFNEFTPLFERRQTQLNATGVAGNNDTHGGEGVVSMLYDRYSLSAGAFGYRTDGWRRNNDNKQDIQDVFFQSAITPELNAQIEFRRRHSDQGDLAFNFDPDSFSPNFRRDIDQDTYRAGLRYSPTPSSKILLSAIYSELTEKLSDDTELPDGRLTSDARGKDDGYQAEGQYLLQHPSFNITTGINYGHINRNIDASSELSGFPLFEPISERENIENIRPYIYGNFNLPRPVTWTLGISYDDYNEAGVIKINRANPKVGAQWDITKDLVLRGAWFTVVKPVLTNNQTLEPTQIAGFNQFFDHINGTESSVSGVGIDWRLIDDLFGGVEATWRNLEVPDGQVLDDQDEQSYGAYINWLPLPELAFTVEFIYDNFKAQRSRLTIDSNVPEQLETISVPIVIRYFHPSGVFADFSTTYVKQDVKRSPDNQLGLTNGDDDFFVLDASVGYRLPKRLGIVSLSVSNLLDNGFKYQDDSFREFQAGPSIGPYFPERMVLGRVTLNW